ncbi:MAG: histidine kinase dimerization/phospho-acceptor domain-containing protein, partial [Thermodesulfovibrionales bacterium]|nr:histidine kinase dimerization/phospho-acceptor domain-containing protein [Thermodesulfovibrionales bacterium]
ILLARFKALLKRGYISSAELISTYNFAEQWTYILAAVAFATGLIVAYALVRPARKLLSEGGEGKNIEEFSSLGKEFTKIAASLSKYTALLESTTGGVMTADKSGTITMVNPYACHILGSKETDLLGKNIGAVLNITRDLQTVLKGKTAASELNITINGESRTIGYTLSPIKGRYGIDGAVLNFMDTTKVKEMYREMQKTEKLANIGTLAMEVAHEIRNPLASIKGLVQLIGEDINDNEQKKLYINTILKETDRLNRVVDTLFEKKTSAGEEDTLRDIIHRVVLLCSQVAKDKAVSIREDYDEAADKMQVGDERFFHALYNIVLNAYEAVGKNGEIAIKTKLTDDRTEIEVSSESEISGGMDTDTIFEADVTTKGKGRGMGLKIARDAMKSIGGDITVETSEGKTKFVISLPPTAYNNNA